MSSLPSPYFKISSLPQPSAAAGMDLLSPISRTSDMIRPKIGGYKGQRNMRKKTRKAQKKGGFLPSVGEAFVAATGKYVAPVALYTLYRFLNSKTRKGKSHSRRSTASKRR